MTDDDSLLDPAHRASHVYPTDPDRSVRSIFKRRSDGSWRM